MNNKTLLLLTDKTTNSQDSNRYFFYERIEISNLQMSFTKGIVKPVTKAALEKLPV